MNGYYTARTTQELLQVKPGTFYLYVKKGKLRRLRYNAYLIEDVEALAARKSKPLDYWYLDHLAHRLTILLHLPTQWKDAHRSLWREAMIALCKEIQKAVNHPRFHAHMHSLWKCYPLLGTDSTR